MGLSSGENRDQVLKSETRFYGGDDGDGSGGGGGREGGGGSLDTPGLVSLWFTPVRVYPLPKNVS